MTQSYIYDYFVIGAGSGGARSARIAHSHGAKVGIAESRHFGGTCVNLGCVPKKLFVYGASYAKHFEDAIGYGWGVDKPSFDWKTLLNNKNNEIERLSSNSKRRMAEAGVKIYDGHAKFIAPHTIQINDEQVTADKILVSVGTTPRRIDIPGKEHFITSDEAFYLDELPETIVIVGGGYIAMEFAHIFKNLGCNVIVMNRSETLLRGFDHDLQEMLIESTENMGIQLDLGNLPTKIEQKSDKKLVIETQNGTNYTCDQIMAAIGRVPKVMDLGLENAGVDQNPDGSIKVDARQQTSVPHIFAVGDVSNDAPLTPVAIREGHALADRLFGGKDVPELDYSYVASAVFTQPPIGTVGITEQQAAAQNIDYTVFRARFRPMKHSLSGRAQRIMMKLLVENGSDKILGIHMFGDDSPEIIQLAATILEMGGTKAQLDKTFAVHPTSAEEFVLMRTPAERTPKDKMRP